MQASIARRAFAFWMDVIIVIGCLILMGNIVNFSGVPPEEYYPPPTAMQLFTARQMEVFWRSAGITTIVVLIYSLTLPMTRVQGTLGQLFADIKLTDDKGERPTFLMVVKRVLLQLCKLASLLVAGPLIAMGGGSASLSLLALLAAGFFLATLPLNIAKQKDKATWVERITGTRFHMRR